MLVSVVRQLPQDLFSRHFRDLAECLTGGSLGFEGGLWDLIAVAVNIARLAGLEVADSSVDKVTNAATVGASKHRVNVLYFRWA